MATYTIFAGVNGAGKTSIYKESVPFEDRIMRIVDPHEMQRLIRRAGYVEMALALKVSSGKLNVCVRNIVNSDEIVDELDYEVKRIGPIRLKDGLYAQKLVLSLI